jgi:hypothetical protein
MIILKVLGTLAVAAVITFAIVMLVIIIDDKLN